MRAESSGAPLFTFSLLCSESARLDRESGPHRALGVVVLRRRIAEIGQNAFTDVFAHGLADEAVEPGDDFGDNAAKCGDDLAQIFGIEPRGERRRADEFADHHREAPPLGG